MASTYTTNKNIEKPGSGDYNGTWNVPVNADWDIIDKALGGSVTLNVTSLSGVQALSTANYQNLYFKVTGTLTANVEYQFPSGVGGQWVVHNAATGSFTLTFSSAGGGSYVVIAAGSRTLIVSDGTNVNLSINAATNPGGVTGSVQFNNAGSFQGEPNFVWDATNDRLGILNASPAYPLDVAGVINSSTGGFRFPDATTQVSAGLTSATAGNGVNLTGTFPALTFNSLVSTMQVFTSSGTFTIPAGVTRFRATVVGPGGNGEGLINSLVALAGNGGGAGGVSIGQFTGVTPGNTITVTVGTPGISSSVSSGTETITTVTATSGSTGTTGGGAGGSGSGGLISMSSAGGQPALAGTMSGAGGTCGGSPFGGGGGRGIDNTTPSNTAGRAGGNFGGGGGGATTAGTNTGASIAGGAGGAGIVVIEY